MWVLYLKSTRGGSLCRRNFKETPSSVFLLFPACHSWPWPLRGGRPQRVQACCSFSRNMHP